MSQYQAYSKPAYSETPPPNAYSTAPPHYHQAPESFEQHPQQSTFPQPQQYTMTTPQQPNMAYQPQQPMSEKPQMQVHQSQVHQSHDNHKAPGNKFGNKWTFGMFDCCSPFPTCLLGSCCPCFLFGKTYAREHGEGETSGCGGMCCVWYLVASVGFNSCLQAVFRGQQRERHGIEGSGFGDCCSSFWCGCCTLIQEEKESIVRHTGMDPTTGVAYQPLNQSMQYPA